MFPSLKQEPWISLDLETHDPDLKSKGPGVRRDGYIVGVALATPNFRHYFPVAHTRGNNIPQIVPYLGEELHDYRGQIIGANIGYDLDYLAHQHVEFPRARFVDVLVAEPLIDENQFMINLDSVSQKYTGETKRYDHMTAKYGPDWIKNIRDCSIEDTAIYALGDVDLPVRVWEAQKKILEAEGLMELCDIEFRLIPLLLYMRRMGCPVDIPAANRLYDVYEERIQENTAKVNHLAGFEINTKSGKDLAVLFDKLGLPYPKTALGNPSFQGKWLETVDHEVAKMIITNNKYRHAQSTFINNYILEGNINGKIHCEFNQAKGDGKGTVSGRFSSSNPNLQNIPSRDDEDFHIGSEIRSLFIPTEGKLWWARDWSQIEYRLFVHYAAMSKRTRSSAMRAVDLYNSEEGVDFHKMVQEWTGLDRKKAKTINFGILYGMGFFKLANSLHVSEQEAKEFLNRYDSNVPFARMLYNDLMETAASRGYIKTILGRKRRFDKWEPVGRRNKKGEKGMVIAHSREEAMLFRQDSNNAEWYNKIIRRAFTHKALNALLQGSAADLMKKAMVEIWEAGLTDYIDIYLTVHDELDGAIDPTKQGSREALDELTRIMESCVKLLIPVVAEGTEGINWAEAK